MLKKIFISLLMLFTAYPLCAEYLFLTDGSIVKGKIVSETAAEVSFRNEQKKVERYPRSRVMRVLYTELNMSKIYVQKKNGENMKVFMVDEDRDTYTFRNEIDKPEEFKVKRSDVLFVAERNPSGLKGEPGYSNIRLEWYPPYDKMKYFNIYSKKKKEDQYAASGTSKNNKFKLTGLAGNTKYFIIVTGVDDKGTETTPSNEMLIATLNRPPSFPAELKVTPLYNGGAVVTWKPALDSDGFIVKYNVYTIKNKKKEFAGDIKGTTFTINDMTAVDSVLVTAVDDALAESGDSFHQTDAFRLYVSLAVIYPLDDFGYMGGLGYGGMMSFMANDFFIKDLTAGFEGGYFYIPGKNSFETDGQNIHRFHIVSAGMKAGYLFRLTINLSVTPAVTLGAAYYNLTYTSRDKFYLKETEKSLNGLDPIAAGSLSIDYAVSDSYFIGIIAGYGMLFEKSSMLQYATCGINLGMRFEP